MEKGFGVFVLFLFVWTAAFVRFTSSQHDVVSMDSNKSTQPEQIRNQQLEGDNSSYSNEDEGAPVKLEDYRPIDPIPSSTNSIRSGPIQHGTPLLPYIPEHSPPPSQDCEDGPPSP